MCVKAPWVPAQSWASTHHDYLHRWFVSRQPRQGRMGPVLSRNGSGKLGLGRADYKQPHGTDCNYSRHAGTWGYQNYD